VKTKTGFIWYRIGFYEDDNEHWFHECRNLMISLVIIGRNFKERLYTRDGQTFLWAGQIKNVKCQVGQLNLL
jgi:hypothetical protein